MMKARGHETVEHTADMGLHAWGRSCEEAFEEAAGALMDLMTDRRGLEGRLRFDLAVTGEDQAELLVEFLNEMLSLADIEEAVLTGVSVERCLDEGDCWSLRAVVSGVPRDACRGRMLREVKAVTWYGTSVAREENGPWVARCVVDL